MNVLFLPSKPFPSPFASDQLSHVLLFWRKSWASFCAFEASSNIPSRADLQFYMVTMIFPAAARASWCICLCINKKRKKKKLIWLGSKQGSIILCLLTGFADSFPAVRGCRPGRAAVPSTWWLCSTRRTPAISLHSRLWTRATEDSDTQLQVSYGINTETVFPHLQREIDCSTVTTHPKRIMRWGPKISNLGLRALNIFHCPFKLLLPLLQLQKPALQPQDKTKTKQETLLHSYSWLTLLGRLASLCSLPKQLCSPETGKPRFNRGCSSWNCHLGPI